jgi:DNA-binding response OmpR family regulator
MVKGNFFYSDEKLLIVDASSELRETLAELLSIFGFTVRTADNSKSFFEQFKLFMPEIVLIDVLLKGEDGRAICKALRENHPEVTLILTSNSAESGLNFRDFGADGFIEKLLDTQELLANIEAAVINRKELLTKNSDN